MPPTRTILRSPVPFVDARAADLRLTAGPVARVPLRPALASRPGPRFGAYAMELRVLGASHQVVLTGPDTTWVETLACGTEPDPLAFPHRREFRAPGLDHLLTVRRVTAGSRADFTERAATAAAQCRAHDDSLVVRFEGDPLAVTAIAATARPHALHWQTWHLYPQTGEIVTSESTLRTGQHR